MFRVPIKFPRFPKPTIKNPYEYIYIITNKVSGKQYIGQHHCPYFDLNYWGSGYIIKLLIKKYGKDNFTREVLDWVKSKADADAKEIYWIEVFGTFCEGGYNLTPGGGGCGSGPDNPAYGKVSHLKGKSLSNEHKEKLSAALKNRQFSEEHRKKLSQSAKNRHKNNPWTEEQRKKCSERNKGKNNPMYGRKGENSPIYGRHLTSQHHQKILDWAKTHVNPLAKTVYRYDLQGNFIEKYPSLSAAHKSPEKFSPDCISNCCKNIANKKYVPHKGFFWSYEPPVNNKLPDLN